MPSTHDSNSAAAVIEIPTSDPSRKIDPCYDQAHMTDFYEVLCFVNRLKDIRDEAEKMGDAEGIVNLLYGVLRYADAYVQVRVERIADLMRMDYQDYLSTPEWKHTRERALERAGRRCQLCNSDGPLNVHHNTYERRGYEANTDLLVLCRPCHALHHGKVS